MILSTKLNNIFSSIFGHKGGSHNITNDPMMLERSIWLFRQLECQNLSIISDSLGIYRQLQENAKKKLG